MADVAASILAPAVESSLKSIGAIIKRQFIYLFCFTRNIKGLEDEAKSLNDQVHGVKARVVDEVTNNAREIHPQVTTWLQKSDEFIEEESAILKEVPNVRDGCLRFASRFSLSRRAKKTTEAMAQHRQNSNFDNISLPPPASSTREIPSKKTFSFDSRKKIEQDIMNTLRDKKDTMIAIHGMGGLGKTTMAKRIMNALLNERVFDEVVIAVVSQQVDELKIQCDIGDSLGLTDLKAKTSSQARAQILHARLIAGTTRTLLVLDDVWEKVELEDFGIPCAYEGCTILITSRNSDALRAMDVKNIFEMEQLSKKDAWFMFREIVGTCVDDKELMSTAKEVMRECKGLPIALEALGAALKDEKCKGVWKDALKKLRKPNPRNTPYYIADVYNPLIVSYDKLDKEFKTPFLLCCLFCEDDNISVERLTYFCMGLRLFEDLESLGEVRDRMCSLVKMLKSRSLLLDGDKDDHVRLHDVVRDVCIFIAKQNGYIGGNDCNWISNSQLPDAGTEVSTELRLLFSDDEQFEIDDTYFEGMRELYVLSIEMYSWTSLPLTIQSLNHLRTLILDRCHDLETISVIGSLVHLEILICHGRSRIKELPEEMKGLKNLKLLELTRCDNLESIGRGIISSLVELEELKIFNYSFDGWDAAHLREVGELNKLRCLEIDIADEALVAEDINLSSKPERFQIRFGSSSKNFPKRYKKKMALRLDKGGRLGHWIRKLLKDTECLNVEGNGAADIQNYCSNIQWLTLRMCRGIKSIATTSGVLLDHLGLWYLPQLEEIWNDPANSLTCLQNLKKIELSYLPALKHLWKSNTNIVSLPQLEILEIKDCEMMEHLFVWNNKGSPNRDVIKIQFPQLWKIEIEKCSKMRSIISTTSINGDGSNNKTDIDDHSSHLVSLPQLKMLEIYDCKMMEHLFVWGKEGENEITNRGLPNATQIQGVKFPLLWKMKIMKCPKMRSITGNSNTDTDDHLSHFFCHPEKVSFGRFKELEIEWNPFCHHHHISASFFNEIEKLSISKYHGSLSLFTATIARYLVNLKELNINDCDEMVAVIEDDNEEGIIVSDGECNRPFHNLQKLCLINLRKLVRFCNSKSDVELPSLKWLDITRCRILSLAPLALDYLGNLKEIELWCLPALKHLWKSNTNIVSLPQLETLVINRCEMMEQLFVWSEEDENEITKRGSPNSDVIKIQFPQLQKMEIRECPKLRSIISTTSLNGDGSNNKTDIDDHSSHLVSLPQLEILVIKDCEMMEQVFVWSEEDENKITNRGSPNATQIQGVKLPLLQIMKIMGCPKMRSITFTSISKTDIDDHSSHLFCQPEKVSFGRLWELETGQWNPFCHHIHIYASFFNGIEKFSIHEYHGNLILFTATITRNLINLKELWISDCDEMVAVMEDDKEKGITLSDGECFRPFPNLQILGLKRLRKLVSFCNSKSNVELPSLKRLDISRCPNTTTNLSLAPLALEEVRTDLDCYLGVLFKETGNYPSCSLHETRIFPFVNGLQELCIHNYEGSMSIFSSLIAENLINLRILEIYFCDEIVKVIEGGERSGTLLFPKLQRLDMLILPKLEIFCEWKSKVELPLLKELNINECPNMMKFTLGSVTTPCLNFVGREFPNKYGVDGTTDLNGALQQHFAKEKEITNEDDDDDENRDSEGDTSNGDGDVDLEKGTNEASEREDEQSTSDDEKMDQINE